MNLLLIATASIVIHGNFEHGIWSPSHPELYPPPYIPIPMEMVDMEEIYTPDVTLTDEDGNPLIK